MNFLTPSPSVCTTYVCEKRAAVLRLPRGRAEVVGARRRRKAALHTNLRLRHRVDVATSREFLLFFLEASCMGEPLRPEVNWYSVQSHHNYILWA